MRLEASRLQRLIRRLTGYAISRGLARADAEDCAQETALILARKYPDKDEADSVPLAFRIIRWKISEHHRIRSAQRGGRAMQMDALDDRAETRWDQPSVEDAAILREAVQLALGRLSAKCRALLLWQLEGLSGDEIARKMGLATRNAAYIAINRCKKRFRKAYEALQQGPSGPG